MKWMNYNHLHYFWIVAREGSVVKAAEVLMVSQPTISAQLKDLEASLGQRLFERVGRGLRLTEAGRIAFNYANEIFSLGQEMANALERRPSARPVRLAAGIVDVIPKPVAQRLLEPALQLKEPVRLVCPEDQADRLLADLAARRLDLVLSDSPIGAAMGFEGFNHLLGECGICFFATGDLAKRYGKGFPASLDGAPMLLPSAHTAIRRPLDLWFDRQHIHPVAAGEFDDSALMYSFGQSGMGVFPVPLVVERRVGRELGVKCIGRTDQVKARFYAISAEEEPSHPAVQAIRAAARQDLFPRPGR